MKSLNKITLKYILLNKKRSIITILSIVLSATLLFSLGLVFSSYRGTMLKEMDKEEYNWHVVLTERSQEDLKKIKNAKYYKENVEVISFENKPSLAFYYTDNKKHINEFEGTYPKKENEIAIKDDYKKDYKIGDTFSIHDRKYVITGFFSYLSTNVDTLNSNFSNEFLVAVPKENIRIVLKFDNVKKAYKQIENLTDDLGIKQLQGDYVYENTDINHSYLQLQGNHISNPQNAIILIAILIISISIGLFCIAIIYNSFSISVKERKKMYGVLQCLGATDNKLYWSVLSEAFMEALVGIPLGLILSIITVKSGISIYNTILSDVDGAVKIEFLINFLYMTIPSILIFFVIYLGMYRNAAMVRKMSPIEAIRSNKDIKIKSKKKESKIIKKIFGLEGVLAFQNMKRNKANYRSTIITIAICLFLFITTTTFINFVEEIIKINMQQYETDAMISINKYDNNVKTFIDKILKNKNIKDYDLNYSQYLEIDITNTDFNTENNDIVQDNKIRAYISYDKQYEKYNKKYNSDILIQNIHTKSIEDEDDIQIKMFNSLDELKIVSPFVLNVSNFKLFASDNDDYKYFRIYASKKFMETNVKDMNIYLSILSKDSEAINNEIKRLLKESGMKKETYTYLNTYEEFMDVKKKLFASQFVVYSILGLLTLISITGIINAVFNSIQNRKKEFAILKSLGISEYKFDKMILIETFSICLKALFYGLGVSILAIEYARQKSRLSNNEGIILIDYPDKYILYAIVAVIILMTSTMLYAVSKTKKDNIIETIRNENI